VRRFLVIVLLALLPVQFTWSAVAAHCGHEAEASQLGTGHVSHDEHQHHGKADVGGAEDAGTDQAAGGIDFDCGHCHGHFTGMLTVSSGLPSALANEPPGVTADEASAAYASTRPERPQWSRLA
jgi:hypothetical protein